MNELDERREPAPLDEVRSELQRLGYLSHRFERFLLSDALVPRGPWRGLLRLAAKVGAAAGSLIAAVNALALAVANRVLDGASFDLLPLFLHVALPVFLGTALGFLVVVLLFRALLRLFPRRGLDIARLGAALGATALLFGVGLYLATQFLLALTPAERALAAALLLAVAASVAKLLADGLLAFGIRLTHAVPHERLVPRRWVGVTVATSAAAMAAISLLLGPASRPQPPAALPSSAGDRVVLIGLDGVLPDELDFELSQGGLPELGRMARDGGVVARYRRAAGASPAEVWTTIATGRPASAHGVVAVDGFRPKGMTSTLARTGPWRLWFERLEAPLGLAEHRPLLSGRRRTPAFWELIARGGRPVLAVNWWGTYPAEPLAGLVVAHGAFELLAPVSAPGAPGALAAPSGSGVVAPIERAPEVEALLAANRTPADAELLLDLPEATRRPVVDALEADRFHRALVRELGHDARAVAVYLPALDLVAHASSLGAPRFGELVRRELLAADRLVAELAADTWGVDAARSGATTIVVLFDPGRRDGGEGRVLIWRSGCAASSRPEVALESVAAALLRAAGLPQSRELSEPPPFCPWPEALERVPTYGERADEASGRADDAAYLDNLRSLGYL